MIIHRSLLKHSTLLVALLTAYLIISYGLLSWSNPLEWSTLTHLNQHSSQLTIKNAEALLLLLTTSSLYLIISAYLFTQMVNTLNPKYLLDDINIIHSKLKTNRLIAWTDIKTITPLKHLNAFAIEHTDANKQKHTTILWFYGLEHSAKNALQYIQHNRLIHH